jgi:anti-sigma factor (TIGR02949 family)
MSGEGCREMFSRLSEYLDGELPEDLCERIEGHMEGCAPCKDFLASLEQTIKLIGSSDALRLPDDLRQALCAAWKKGL